MIFRICYGAIRYICLLIRNVNVFEQILLHVPVVALVIVCSNRIILVKVEGCDLAETQSLIFVHLYQAGICLQWC